MLMPRTTGERIAGGILCQGLADPQLDALLPAEAVQQLREDVEMVRELCSPLSLQSYREGNLTPMYFGSALNNFGVRELLDGLVEMAPPPRLQHAQRADGAPRDILPDEGKVTGFVFKIQANMDPKHRDRIAFVRLCSGPFRRGMKLLHPRSKKTMAMHNPLLFMAQDREI